MAKYYKVIKDHPMWEVGAILHNVDADGDPSDSYYPINDLWVKDIEGVNERWCEGGKLVENQPEWFQRVYKVNVLKQAKYLAKEEARKAYDKLHKEK